MKVEQRSEGGGEARALIECARQANSAERRALLIWEMGAVEGEAEHARREALTSWSGPRAMALVPAVAKPSQASR
jgi:hypothetical protein